MKSDLAEEFLSKYCVMQEPDATNKGWSLHSIFYKNQLVFIEANVLIIFDNFIIKCP